MPLWSTSSTDERSKQSKWGNCPECGAKFQSKGLVGRQIVQNSLKTHLEPWQYHQVKQMGLPIGSGMVERACKWLITQRFKGVGMRWSESGCDHLLYFRVAWVNQRFDELFADYPLSPTLYSPNQ